MTLMDDETLQMYIDESKEHLETIESDLLEIEKGGDAIDEDLVNKVFRAAHSIKGGGGFLGLDNIKELSHKIENVLDMIRNLQLVPTPDIVNTVLVAFDRLGELLDDALNSNEMAIDAHVIALKGIVEGSFENGKKGTLSQQAQVSISDGGPCFKVSQFDLDQARKGGKNLYILEFDMIKDVQRKGKTPLDVINSLGDGGVELDIQIGMAVVGDLDSDDIAPILPMYVLYASIIEQDLIGMLLNLDDDKITLVPKGSEAAYEQIHLEGGETPDKAQIAKAKKTEKESKGAKEETPKPKNAEISSEPVKKIEPENKPGARSESLTGLNKTKMVAKAENLRVSVAVLDQLMNRAGELVLARNQLLQALNVGDKKTMTSAGQRINQVTSELQEAIMLTRMQQVGTIFNKFTRLVRDLARNLEKEMSLSISGDEVELDKSIIEGLGDPLTHLVRNSCDHGIEAPDVRVAKGKPAEGSIWLRAFHESGQVIIEIEDDGKGLDAEKIAQKAVSKNLVTEAQVEVMTSAEKANLIMLPGFSMAEQVTEVSGRGVGMDVVKTNLDKMGGQVDLISELDKGTTVRIKLPLTLAIIPSLLIECCGDRYAVPQVNVCELLRVAAAEMREKIEKVGDADVLILRGELIPLLQLNNVLGLTQTYYDQKAGKFRQDRRAGLVDQRLMGGLEKEETSEEEARAAEAAERRNRPASDVSIVILQLGAARFGLVVEKVHDTVEIVVKPLGRHLKNCNVYAGATIMGDGLVALILDVAGLAKIAELKSGATDRPTVKKEEKRADGATRQTLLLFHNGPDEYCAVPLHQVLRVEQIEAADIEIKSGKKVIQYRGGSLPVFALEEVANVDIMEERRELIVIIFVVSGHEIGLLAIPPVDVIDHEFILDEETLSQPGISGSTIINGKTTLLVDIFGFIKVLNPQWFENRRVDQGSHEMAQAADLGKKKPILLAEDSDFFRAQVTQFLQSEGHAVVGFEDGLAAWKFLDANPDEFSLVVTDLEMPNLDGFGLTKKIKEDERFAGMKVIALTSLAGEEDLEKGKEVGIDDYQIKMDKEKLLQGIHKYLSRL